MPFVLVELLKTNSWHSHWILLYLFPLFLITISFVRVVEMFFLCFWLFLGPSWQCFHALRIISKLIESGFGEGLACSASVASKKTVEHALLFWFVSDLVEYFLREVESAIGLDALKRLQLEGFHLQRRGIYKFSYWWHLHVLLPCPVDHIFFFHW